MSRATLIYFSPTGTTKKIVEGIAAGLGAGAPGHINLTLPSFRTAAMEIQQGLSIIGVPVYAGRVPEETVRRLGSIRGDRTPAVLVVVYGNRAYDDALLELRDLSVKQGFLPVAGCTFIGEHSFATVDVPIANGRPDEDDLKRAGEFGGLIRKKLSAGHPDQPLHVPGNFPYKERSGLGNISPVTREDLCILCGTCASLCPAGAITVDEAVSTDRSACIRCCACVKNCPSAARAMEEPSVRTIAEWLSTSFRDRKEPEFFL